MAIEVLGALRHACIQCGGSCQGSYVVMLSEGEEARVRALAAELGIDDPIVDGHLRQEHGVCAFLDDDDLCRIHKAHGLEAKPTACKQFPILTVRTRDGLRVGIDPGCYAGQQTWHTAPPIEPGRLVATPVGLPDDQHQVEQWVLDLSEEATSVGDVLARLTGDTPADGALPEGFAGRWVQALQRAGLAPWVSHPDTPRAIRERLGPVVAAIDTWSATDPPGWSLDPELQAWAIESMRRTVHLRVTHGALPSVAGVALLALGGAVAAAWTDPAPLPFAFALAAWSRATRHAGFVASIVPDGAALAQLARGA